MADKAEAKTATAPAQQPAAKPEFNPQDSLMINTVDESGENLKQTFVSKFTEGQKTRAVDEDGNVYDWTDHDYMQLAAKD
jgi:hypothetical protein